MTKKIYIIAEIGNTHDGSLGLAKKFIEVAADCGADAVKFQMHIFDEESLPNAPNPPYFKSESREQYFKRTSFSDIEWKSLKKYAEKYNLDFLNSPFSIVAVDRLKKLGIKAIKVPSGEVTNIPLLERISKLFNKVYLSTGMSSWIEINNAIKVIKKNKKINLTLMQCTSMYPCDLKYSGINVIKEFNKKYKNLNIGFSDHTNGISAPIAAVMEGAVVIEKHITLSKDMYGSDAKNSMEPHEFKNLVDQIRNIEIIKNSHIDKNKLSKKLVKMKKTFEKSIVAAGNLDKGKIITFKDLAFKKPGNGISAANYKSVIGKKLKKAIKYNDQIKFDNLL